MLTLTLITDCHPLGFPGNDFPETINGHVHPVSDGWGAVERAQTGSVKDFPPKNVVYNVLQMLYLKWRVPLCHINEPPKMASVYWLLGCYFFAAG